MRLARTLVIVAVVASLVAAFVVDGRDRPVPADVDPDHTSVASTEERGIWFCPGGSAPGGDAEVGIELINAGQEAARAIVTGVRSGTGVEPRVIEVVLEPGERHQFFLAEIVTDSAWMGAVVEVDSPLVVVEQTYIGAGAAGRAATGSDRAPCHTRTGTSWIVASGATRPDPFFERMTLLVLNPFLDDAVLDISFDSDVGIDSLPGVVVPAQRVVAIDVTEIVTVASRVSAVVDVVAGRVAVSRIQVVDNETVQGLAVTPASDGPAAVWYLPTVHRTSRRDVVTVVNPSASETAKVDLEVVADGDVDFNPIELTIRPGRSVAVVLADEARLEGANVVSIVARSLTGLPVAVMVDSALPFGELPVSNLSASAGVDVASTRWIAPMESDEGAVVIYNPSATTIATATVSVVTADGVEAFTEVEIGPDRRAEVPSASIGVDRPVLVVESTSPVVVGREFTDVSVHELLLGIAVDEPVSVID